MKHHLIDKLSLGNHNWRVIIELIPDNPAEAVAIQNVAQVAASEQERELVETYLHLNLGLGDYSIVEVMQQQGRRVALRIFA